MIEPSVSLDRELAELLEGTAQALTKYVVFSSEAQVTAVTLWAAHTHVYDQFETTPYLDLTSPDRRCGKTRLLDVLEPVVRDPWRVVTPSEAVVFRKLSADHPTLLLDEVDALYGPRASAAYEGLRAMLNAGHRAGTRVPRCVGDKMTLQDFDVFSPKALAGIGDLPDTIADRSIMIRLARRAPGERITRFRRREAEAELADLRLCLEEWAAHTNGLGEERPEVPPELDDRAADSWEPLFALANRAGHGWAERARAAAVALSVGRDSDDASLGIRLLSDCREVFGDADRLATQELVRRLVALEESPWADLHGHEVNPRGLVRLLRPYDVHSKQVRFGDSTCKGYLREDFHDAWSRYLPGPASPEATKQEKQAKQGACDAFGEAEQGSADTKHDPDETEQDEAHVSDVPAVSLTGEDDGSEPLPADLLINAADVVISNGAASSPVIKKRCDCSSQAADAVMAVLESVGIIGPGNGKARSVIVDDPDEAHRRLRNRTGA